MSGKRQAKAVVTWIDVTKAKPHPFIRVLMALDYGKTRLVCEGSIDDNEYWHFGGAHPMLAGNHNVVAWAEMPTHPDIIYGKNP